MKKTTLCLFSLIFPQLLFGQIVYNDCPSSYPVFERVLLVEEDGSKGTCQDVEVLKEVLDDVHKFTRSRERIMLNFMYEHTGAQYQDYGIINIPLNMIRLTLGSQVNYTVPFELRKTTFAHEYGHSVLSTRFAKDLNVYKILKRDFLYYRILIQSLFRLSEEAGKWDGSENEGYRVVILRELENIEKEIDSFNPNENQEMLRFYKITGSYHEFFADIVAIFYADDPQGMAKTFHYPNIKGQDKINMESRDFTVIHRLETWNQEGEHNALTPTRSFYYLNYYSDGMSNIEKFNHIEKIYQAILNQVNYRIENNLHEMNVKDINQFFIKELKYTFDNI